jgi:hypothetical protein
VTQREGYPGRLGATGVARYGLSRAAGAMVARADFKTEGSCVGSTLWKIDTAV